MRREGFIKRAVPEVVNDYGEIRKTREDSIVFPNGWVASIVENTHSEKNAKYSVAMCDYNGYFDWEILNQYGADAGCFYCNSEEEICEALSIIENLHRSSEGGWCCKKVTVKSWTDFDGRETEMISQTSEGLLTVDEFIKLLEYAKKKWGNKNVLIHDVNLNVISGFYHLYLHHGFDEQEKKGENHYEDDSICILF